VSELVERWRGYYADFNEQARSRDIARSLPGNICGPTMVDARRDNEMLALTTARADSNASGGRAWQTAFSDCRRMLSLLVDIKCCYETPQWKQRTNHQLFYPGRQGI
jgi:hypothetical protein